MHKAVNFLKNTKPLDLLKQTLLETTRPKVIVDRKVLEAVIERFDHMTIELADNSGTGYLDRLSTGDLIYLAADCYHDHGQVVDEIGGALQCRELTEVDLVSILTVSVPWPFWGEFVRRLLTFGPTKKAVLRLYSNHDALLDWNNADQALLARVVLNQNPTISELKSVLFNLTKNACPENDHYEEIVKLLEEVRQLIKEKELFEKAEAEAEALKKARDFMSEEELTYLHSALERLADSISSEFVEIVAN